MTAHRRDAPKLDPAHAAAYRANGAREIAALKALDKELAAKLAAVRAGLISSSTTPIIISKPAMAEGGGR